MMAVHLPMLIACLCKVASSKSQLMWLYLFTLF